MNNRKVIPMSERLQILYFLMQVVGVKSILKLIFLTEIIFGAKGSIDKLANAKKMYDFCSELLKTSNFTIQNQRSKKDVIDILAMLRKKHFIAINGMDIELLSSFNKVVELNVLSDTLAKKLEPFIEMTNESFLEEIIKYAKDY